MASQDDKSEADAKRMGARSFPGYLADRATGRADFKKAPDTKAPASALPLEVKKTRRQGVTDDAYAKGGTASAKKDLDRPIPGEMVRSGGKLVPRYFKDTPDTDPIRNWSDKGRGLEVEPDAGRKYAAGGMVRRGFGKARGA